MRLIDADAFKKYMLSGNENDHTGVGLMLRLFSACIDDLPTVDAEPVRHGHWERVIPTKNAAKWSTKVSCSVCHKQGYTHHNYCPNYGAKMDEVSE